MHRILFYSVIILLVVLVFAFVDFFIYRLLRIILSKASAQITNYVLLAVFFLLIGISTWWGHTHTRLQIAVTHSDILSSRIPSAFDGFRIVQISDLHLDSFSKEEGHAFLSNLVGTIQSQEPDLIVFTGDIVTLRAAQLLPYTTELAALGNIPHKDGQNTVPVYSILGNHDYADYVHNFTPERRQKDIDSLLMLQDQAGWKMLRNSSVFLERFNDNDSIPQQIGLVGVENIGEPPFSVYGDLELAMGNIGGIQAANSFFTILLSHNPTHWRSEVIPRTSIDLTLSGHTHATQILIGSWSPAKWKYDEWMGLYTDGQQKLYVNTGIGCVGPKVRIGIAPEVSVLTLRKN